MIRADEIDPVIQSALAERMTQIFTGGAPLDPVAARVKAAGAKAWQTVAMRYAGYYVGAALCFGLSVAVPLAIDPKGEGSGGMWFMLINMATSGLLIVAHLKIREEQTRTVNPEVMRSAPLLLPLSQAERLYCEAVAALLDAGRLLGEAPQREILVQLNELVASFRKLELTVNHYRSAAASQPVEQIQRELAVLTQRRDALGDAAARETANQSVRLCEQRLEQARRVEPVCQRAQAQQDLVLQMLASLQATLARVIAAGKVHAEGDVVGVRETVEQISIQTRAVEEAVNEVLLAGR